MKHTITVFCATNFIDVEPTDLGYHNRHLHKNKWKDQFIINRIVPICNSKSFSFILIYFKSSFCKQIIGLLCYSTLKTTQHKVYKIVLPWSTLIPVWSLKQTTTVNYKAILHSSFFRNIGQAFVTTYSHRATNFSSILIPHKPYSSLDYTAVQ